MKRLSRFIAFIIICSGLIVTWGCKNKNNYTSPEGYDFQKPDRFNMPSSLLEVSGIALKDGNPDAFYSIQDEEGKVFKQKWDVKKQTNTKFAPGADFEDLAIYRDKMLILNSNGSIFSLPMSELSKKESKAAKESKHLIPKADYESIYADPDSNRVYILCKSCKIDKKAKQVTGYILNYNYDLDSFSLASTFTIDLTDIVLFNPKLKASLSPSALTKNPKTGEWYILSSANKLLVVADANWKIKGVHRLNSSTFNQPEGLAFDAANNLYIANEGDEVTDGNILKFKHALK
ncbi:MAG: SdiA-regulated domain-containing protein [Bacteroidota bacterium]